MQQCQYYIRIRENKLSEIQEISSMIKACVSIAANDELSMYDKNLSMLRILRDCYTVIRCFDETNIPSAAQTKSFIRLGELETPIYFFGKYDGRVVMYTNYLEAFTMAPLPEGCVEYKFDTMRDVGRRRSTSKVSISMSRLLQLANIPNQ